MLTAATLAAFTKSGTVYTTDGSQADVNAAIADASSGDTVDVPASPFTWGAGGLTTTLDKPITLRGAGSGSTTINLHTGGPTGSNGGVIRLTANGAVVKGFTINGASGVSVTAIWISAGVTGWKISDLYYNGTSTGAYAVYGGKGSDNGLIRKSTFFAGSTTAELIYFRGADNSWDAENTFGTANNLVVENCTFGKTGTGAGYVCDINANGHAVFRFNTITGQNKIDGHGAASNSPAVSVRNMEVYGNVANGPTGTWKFIEIRGGENMVWGNVNKSGGTSSTASIRMVEYGASTQNSAFGSVYQTPADYPVITQVGRGRFAVAGDPSTAVSSPAYWWRNRKNGALQSLTWDATGSRSFSTDAAGYSAGVSTITITGAGSGPSSASTGSYFKVQGDSTYYLITSGTTSSPGSITFTPALAQSIPAAVTPLTYSAVTNYQGQTGNPSATFTMGPTAPCIIAADRDYFIEVSGFNGSTGMGVGTAAQMNAITPSLAGVGFWVTDEGSWNQSFSGTVGASSISADDYCEIVSVGTTDFTLIGAEANSVGETFLATGAGSGTGTVKPAQGRLYTWNGSAWTLKYTPYTYPHPLASDDEPPPSEDTTPPTPNPATIASATATGPYSVSVTATTATDAGSPPVVYDFAIDGVWQGVWQSSATYSFTGLTPATTYAFRVRSRDAAGNVTTQSSASNVATQSLPTVRKRGLRGPRL